MKKVCFVVSSLNAGGIENYLLRFLTQYDTMLNATVFCKGGNFGELEDQYRTLSNIELVKSKLTYFDIRAYYSLYFFFRREEYDAVCDFTGNFAGIVLWIARLAGILNRIAFYRGSSNHFKETPFRIWYNRFVNFLVVKHATSILSNSKTAFSFFFKKTDHRFKVIYNGVDSKTFEFDEIKEQIRQELGIPLTAYVIGHTGRVHYSKNHETILKVANQLCSKYPDIHFVLCGKNTERELATLIKPEVREQVHLLGYRSDVARVLKAFDVYFFPSVTEGQPNALIEAMIAGLPIVASSIDPIKETVPDEAISSLVSPMDSKQFMALLEQAYLQQNNQSLARYKDWAISNFNPAIQFLKFYKQLIV